MKNLDETESLNNRNSILTDLLCYACLTDNLELANFLITKRANVDAFQSFGSLIRSYARLLELLADSYLSYWKYYWKQVPNTPLMLSVFNPQICSSLLRREQIQTFVTNLDIIP